MTLKIDHIFLVAMDQKNAKELNVTEETSVNEKNEKTPEFNDLANIQRAIKETHLEEENPAMSSGQESNPKQVDDDFPNLVWIKIVHLDSLQTSKIL